MLTCQQPSAADLSGNTGIPAPYGRACSNCAHAKCKCIYRREGTDCERCHRLKKTCNPAVPARRRISKKTTTSARTAALEEKLDDLVSLLKSSRPQDHKLQAAAESIHIGLAAAAAAAADAESAADGKEARTSNSLTTSPPEACQPTPTSLSVSVSQGQSAASHTEAEKDDELPPELTPKVMDECLDRFRNHMVFHFPFMYIPPDMTPQQLQETRPFLFIVIINAATKISSLQAFLTEKIRSAIAREIVLDQERLIDHVLGLLCFLGWGQLVRKDRMARDRPFISVYAGLLMALVYDLGLSKPKTESVSLLSCFRLGKDSQNKKPPPPERLNMEERRAALATFLLTSQLSASLKRLDALRWTAQLDECLKTLTEKPEYDGDSILVAQVRLQLVMEQLNRAEWDAPTRNLPPRSAVDSHLPTQGLSSLHIELLRARMTDIKNSIPDHLSHHPAFLMHLHMTQLFLSESALLSPSPSSATQAQLNRISNLTACADALAHFYDVFFSVTGTDQGHVGFVICGWLAHGLLSLYGLTKIDEPGWDREALRQTIDVLGLLDRFLSSLPVVKSKMVADEYTEEIFQNSLKMMGSMRETWGLEFGERRQHGQQSSRQQQQQQQQQPPQSQPQGPGQQQDQQQQDQQQQQQQQQHVLFPVPQSGAGDAGLMTATAAARPTMGTMAAAPNAPQTDMMTPQQQHLYTPMAFSQELMPLDMPDDMWFFMQGEGAGLF